MERNYEQAKVKRGSGIGDFVRRVLAVPEMGVVIPLVLFVVIFTLINPAMLSPINRNVMLRTIAFTGVVAVGMSYLMIAGEIDLSVGSVAGLAAVIFGWTMKEQGWSIPAAIGAGLAIGAACGLVNGLLTVRVGLPAFISTLSMLFVARGLNYVITSAAPVYPLPPEVGKFGLETPLGASWAFWLFVALVVVGDLVLRFTIYGSMVTATGGNKQAARVAGISTDGVKIACFILTSMMAAVGGMLVVARIKMADPQIGVGWELDVIASTVIGGVSFLGGVGTILGTFFGVILMQVVRTGLVISHVSALWQNAAIGMLLIGGVALDTLRRRSKRGAR
jgi:ribose transport system permease protein